MGSVCGGRISAPRDRRRSFLGRGSRLVTAHPRSRASVRWMRSRGRRPAGASAFGLAFGVWVVALAVLGAVVTPARVVAASGSSTVEVLHLDGEVNTVAANYLAAGLDRAGRDRVGAVVLVINTPGGLSSAMDQMVTS